MRSASKGSGWRTIEGCLFREQAGWSVSVCPSVLIYEECTKATVWAKPMAIDPIFWDIVGLPENADAPLSFRLNGAWTCHAPPFDEVSIEENTDPNVVATRLLDSANERLGVVERQYRLPKTSNEIGRTHAGGHVSRNAEPHCGANAKNVDNYCQKEPTGGAE